MKGNRAVLASAMIFASIALGAEGNKLVLAGDHWPPYVNARGDSRDGFMVELAREAFKLSDIELEYQERPWARCLKLAAEGTIDGVIGIYFTEARKLGFVIPEESLGLSVNRFYTLNASSWRYTGIPSLENVTIAAIEGYDYGELNDYLASDPAGRKGKVIRMYGDGVLEGILKMLVIGRIDAAIEDELVMAYMAERTGITSSIREAGEVNPINPVGIAFSPVMPSAARYASALDSGIRELRKSGRLARILDSYGLKDWQ